MSFIFELSPSANGYNAFSTNVESFSTTVLQPLVITNVWKRFRDDVFVLWEHGTASFSSFLDYLNIMDKTGKIKFTTEIAGDKGLEFLDLKLRIKKVI